MKTHDLPALLDEFKSTRSEFVDTAAELTERIGRGDLSPSQGPLGRWTAREAARLHRIHDDSVCESNIRALGLTESAAVFNALPPDLHLNALQLFGPNHVAQIFLDINGAPLAAYLVTKHKSKPPLRDK
jgi:hypothetical protein